MTKNIMNTLTDDWMWASAKTNINDIFNDRLNPTLLMIGNPIHMYLGRFLHKTYTIMLVFSVGNFQTKI